MIWKDIPNWKGFYQVSDHGQVKEIRNSKLGSRTLAKKFNVSRSTIMGVKNGETYR